jgi:hypothetical protein
MYTLPNLDLSNSTTGKSWKEIHIQPNTVTFPCFLINLCSTIKEEDTQHPIFSPKGL